MAAPSAEIAAWSFAISSSGQNTQRVEIRDSMKKGAALEVESVKIIIGCIVAAVIYGVVHDQFTAHICVEYFTVFHPPVFHTQSPTLLALGWGVIATWWAGAIVGILLAVAARAGSRPKLPFHTVTSWLLMLMALMGFCAIVSGTIGYFWAPIPKEIADALPVAMQRRFLADWWAHGASYISGFTGGALLCVGIWIKRNHVSASLGRGEHI